MQDHETTSSVLYRTNIKHLHSRYSNLRIRNLNLNNKCELIALSQNKVKKTLLCLITLKQSGQMIKMQEIFK